VFLADEAYHIGPSPSKESYLNFRKIIEVAKQSGADAIHPGYGFLSENPVFVRACREAGIAFIGPTPENMEAMGDKLSAKALMRKANVPLVPGSEGGVESIEEAREIENRIPCYH
jgi:acetyl-CoA carboxylase biotin carboxylase subunit